MISQINQDRIPSLVLRTERELDKVTLKILEELERLGAAIVLRKPQAITLIDAIDTLSDLESRKIMITNRAKTSSTVAEEISWIASMHSLVVGS